MKVKGKFLGGLIGVCCGGPLGLLAGLAVGHIVDTFSSTFSDAAGGGLAFAARERFVEYICEGISKIAKADGRVSELEIAEVEKIFAEAGFDSEMRSRAIGVFRASKATPDTLADVARRFAIAFPKYEFRENFFLMMIRVAACDGGINDSERSALVAAAEEYGKSLGLAFQIKDDLLDIEGSAENMGKAVGKDSVIHKVTYPSVYGTDRSKYALRQLTDKAIAAAKCFPCEEGAQMLADYAKSLMDRVN